MPALSIAEILAAKKKSLCRPEILCLLINKAPAYDLARNCKLLGDWLGPFDKVPKSTRNWRALHSWQMYQLADLLGCSKDDAVEMFIKSQEQHNG